MKEEIYHCICFSWTSLAIRENAHVVPIAHTCNEWLGVLENRVCAINYFFVEIKWIETAMGRGRNGGGGEVGKWDSKTVSGDLYQNDLDKKGGMEKKDDWEERRRGIPCWSSGL
jgi:hypothetical protein